MPSGLPRDETASLQRDGAAYMGEGIRFRLACTLIERMTGLLKNDVCIHGEILVLLSCRSIHTFGMKEDIDVAFIDTFGCVVKTVRSLPPRQLYSCGLARVALERRSRVDIPWFESGDIVRFIV